MVLGHESVVMMFLGHNGPGTMVGAYCIPCHYATVLEIHSFRYSETIVNVLTAISFSCQFSFSPEIIQDSCIVTMS